MHARSLGGLAASWKRSVYAMAEVKRGGAQANRAAAAVVGVVVAHRRPLIQWREVPLSPSQSQHSPSLLPPLHPLSSLFPPLLSPHGVGRGSHSLTHSLTHACTHHHTHACAGTHTHTRAHTHTHTHTSEYSGWTPDASATEPTQAEYPHRAAAVLLSGFLLFSACVRLSVCVCVCVETEREGEREGERERD